MRYDLSVIGVADVAGRALLGPLGRIPEVGHSPNVFLLFPWFFAPFFTINSMGVVPSFAFFCNYPDDVKQPYKNYLENQLRELYNFKGVPVRIFFRKK